MTKKKRVEPFRLESVLAQFRGLETNQDALVVLGDEAAMKCLIAWSHVDNEWVQPETSAPPSIAGKMSKLWGWIIAGWNIDSLAPKIAKLAGVPRGVAIEKMEILAGNRLIYPDGSMAQAARTALSFYTAKKLGIKQQPPKQPAPPRAGRKVEGIDDGDDRGN